MEDKGERSLVARLPREGRCAYAHVEEGKLEGEKNLT